SPAAGTPAMLILTANASAVCPRLRCVSAGAVFLRRRRLHLQCGVLAVAAGDAAMIAEARKLLLQHLALQRLTQFLRVVRDFEFRPGPLLFPVPVGHGDAAYRACTHIL